MLLYEMFAIGIAVVLVVAAIDGLAARVMMGPEETALSRLARAAPAQRRLVASAAQQERDARKSLARVRQGSRLRNRFIGPSQVISNSRLVCCPSSRISRRGDSSLVTFSTIAPSRRSTRCANLPRWAD